MTRATGRRPLPEKKRRIVDIHVGYEVLCSDGVWREVAAELDRGPGAKMPGVRYADGRSFSTSDRQARLMCRYTPSPAKGIPVPAA